jgi:hypothetical protein
MKSSSANDAIQIAAKKGNDGDYDFQTMFIGGPGPTVRAYTTRFAVAETPQHYVIRCEGLDVGRVYLTRVPAGDRWLWTIFMNGHGSQG